MKTKAKAPSTRIRLFLKTKGFFMFSKKSAYTRNVFKKFLHVHIYPQKRFEYARRSFDDIWRHRFRKPPFSSVHTTPKNTRLKKSTIWRPF